MSFGEEFRTARIRADKTLKQVCEMLGRGMSTINRLEDDKKVSERTMVIAEVVLEELKGLGIKSEVKRNKKGNR